MRQLPSHRELPGEVPEMSVLNREGPVEIEMTGSMKRMPKATPRDVLTQRRTLRKKAQFGESPTTPENAPYRETSKILSEALHEGTDDTARAFKAMDERYSKEMDKIAEGNELLFGADDARVPTTKLAARKKAANVLRQSLGNTVAGGQALYQLEEIARLGPDYAEAVRKIAGKVAHEGTRFGLPRVSGSSATWPLQWAMQNLDAGQVHLLEPFSRNTSRALPRVSVAEGLYFRNPAEAYAARAQKEREDEEARRRREEAELRRQIQQASP